MTAPARGGPNGQGGSGADARKIAVSTAEAFATTRNPPHAIRLALGSVSLDVFAASLDTVKRVIDAYRY